MKKKYITVSVILLIIVIGIIYYLNQIVILRVVFESKKDENIIQKYAINKKAEKCYEITEFGPYDECIIKTKRIYVWKIDKDKSVNNTTFIKKLGVVEDS